LLFSNQKQFHCYVVGENDIGGDFAGFASTPTW
jgi:hypothetical protein